MPYSSLCYLFALRIYGVGILNKQIDIDYNLIFISEK